MYKPDNSGAISAASSTTPSNELGIQLRERRFAERNREWATLSSELGPGEYDPGNDDSHLDH